MGNTGAIFVLTGIDGSGKATQAGLLVERLKREGRAAAAMDFPRYDGFFGRMAARYLRGEFGDAAEVNPYLAGLIYAADRWEARDEIIGQCASGAVVVCNRYVADNMAHQGCKISETVERRRFYGWVEELEHEVLGLPHPDLNVFLDVPVEAAQRLLQLKGDRPYLRGESHDGHECNLDHLRSARAAYLELAKTYFNWSRIECTAGECLLPPEEIAEKVWEQVRRHLR